MPTNTVLSKLAQCPADHQKALLIECIRELLADFLCIDSAEEIAANENFADLGTDSSQAVDFKTRLESELNCSLRTTVLFDYPNIELLTNYLLTDELQRTEQNQQRTPLNSNPLEKSKQEHRIDIDSEEIAVIAMGGVFPGAANAGILWDKVESGELSDFTRPNGKGGFEFGQIDKNAVNHLDMLGISNDAYALMNRQEQLMYQVISDLMAKYSISGNDLSARKTGVFIGAQQMLGDDDCKGMLQYDDKVAYQIPIPNKISFQLNLRGPSEAINTFCTSVYVAIHRAIQSIRLGECEQAIVGGVNVISGREFTFACSEGLYEDLLSPDNKTRSFSENARGYVRSEGAGAVILKPLVQAEQDGNTIVAVIKSTAVHHGGRGYSLEAPNSQGLKETIKTCINNSGVSSDTIDYVEAHGIGNHLADAMELGAINDAYRALTQNRDKKWRISTIKPTVGHPELAAGIASLIKVIKAFEYRMIPGIAGLGRINSEMAPDHYLILRSKSEHWKNGDHPRRAALNSYAIGGVNAHIVVEEYSPERKSNKANPRELEPPREPRDNGNARNTTDFNLSSNNETILSSIIHDVFELDLKQIDKSLSVIDYGFDSIQVVQFIRRVNEQLGLNIKMGQALGVDDFGAFFRLLECKLTETKGLSRNSSKEANKSFDSRTGYPIAEVQKGLWFLQEAFPDSTSFNVPLVFRIHDKADENVLLQALTIMLDEYPMLRASFVQDKEEENIYQYIRPTEDCLQIKRAIIEPDKDINQTTLNLLRQPFNLREDPLVRLYILEPPDTRHSFVVFIIHHIVIDGFSGILFMHSFWERYRDIAAGTVRTPQNPDLNFLDFVDWEKSYLNSQESIEDLQWWKEQLEDVSPTVNLPYDRLPQPGLPNLGVGRETLILKKTVFSALKESASAMNVNLSVFLLAVLSAFIHKLTQEEDISVTTPVDNRPSQAYENSISCYINLMTTRCQVTMNKTFDALVKETRQRFIGGLDHVNYPFSRLISDLGFSMANPKESPFPVSYTYQNIFDGIRKNAKVFDGIEPIFSVYQEPDNNYTFEVYDLRDGLQINLKYKRSLFVENTIQRHLAYLERLIDGIIENPKRELKDYEVLPETEKHQLLNLFNDTVKEFPDRRCVHEMVESQVERCPSDVAVVFGGEDLTYKALNARANQLAHYLIEQGVEPDTLVGLCFERSLEMVIGLLGILKAGGAYVPLDPAYPADRLQFMLEDSNIALLLTQRKLGSQLPKYRVRTIFLDGDDLFAGQRTDNPENRVEPTNLFYAIYTSGSTGRPKGAGVLHKGVNNLVQWYVNQFSMSHEDRVLFMSALGFDLTQKNIFAPLIVGGTIVIPDFQGYDDTLLSRLVSEQRVTWVNCSPSAFYPLISHFNELDTSPLRWVFLGGEPIDSQRISRWDIGDSCKLVNSYGPTECTDVCAYYVIEDTRTLDNRVIPLGQPISNTEIYILNKAHQPVPIGVAGELCISGIGLGRGYLNQPELTAEKFIELEFLRERKSVYKTGDLARWLPDGNLEFMGRIDDQVKVRGFRVELGEIESVLATHDSIQSAVVIAKKRGLDNQLLAYYTADQSQDAASLRNHLLKELPDYMVPAVFIKIDRIPMSANGKINRKLLQSKEVDIVNQATYVAPSTPLEVGLAKIWADVLDIEKVGSHDNFFDLGGHSLLAIQIASRASKELGLDVTLNALFQAGNIKTLAGIVAKSERVSSENSLTDFEARNEELII